MQHKSLFKKLLKLFANAAVIVPTITMAACRQDNGVLPTKVNYNIKVSSDETFKVRTRYFTPNSLLFDYKDNSTYEKTDYEMSNYEFVATNAIQRLLDTFRSFINSLGRNSVHLEADKQTSEDLYKNYRDFFKRISGDHNVGTSRPRYGIKEVKLGMIEPVIYDEIESHQRGTVFSWTDTKVLKFKLSIDRFTFAPYKPKSNSPSSALEGVYSEPTDEYPFFDFVVPENMKFFISLELKESESSDMSSSTKPLSDKVSKILEIYMGTDTNDLSIHDTEFQRYEELRKRAMNNSKNVSTQDLIKPAEFEEFFRLSQRSR